MSHNLNVPLVAGMLADGVRIGAIFTQDHIHGKLDGGEAYLWIKSDGDWKVWMETPDGRVDALLDITPPPQNPDLRDRATFLLCVDELERRTGSRTHEVDNLRSWAAWQRRKEDLIICLTQLLQHTAQGVIL